MWVHTQTHAEFNVIDFQEIVSKESLAFWLIIILVKTNIIILDVYMF